MKTLLLAATAALGIGTMAQADEVPSLVTILTSGEPQTQLMGMVLTMQAMQQDANAYILLCGPAGDLALKDAPASATAPQKPRDMSPQGLMQKIMQSGATVEVCAIYLPNKGIDATALLNGISAAKPPEVAARILSDDTQIMSF
ncbi:MAG: hypothetical protein WAO78_13970 [Roseovarius sp.]